MTAAPPVVTRFAPSPTGDLHIGGARTALFNWLFARGRGGTFLLRIEDTDRARSTPEATAAILEGLAWLGLDWDGEAMSQFARAERHREAAEALLERGAAYRCYVPATELEERRAQGQALLEDARAAEVEGRSEDAQRLRAQAEPLLARFRSPYRDGAPPPAPDAPSVVRLRAPETGDTLVEDVVQGTVRFPNKDLDDLILLRSDGAPTYNLAVVVDDHDMGVTHIVRGDDHLVNAGRQTLIYQAFGWPIPVFAHVPLIHGPDGKKLSKRHGALGVSAYRDMGYLPEGLRNYLLRLGWSHGDQELFTDAEAKGAFGLEALGKAPARLDFDKLGNVNAHHLRLADEPRLLELALAHRATLGAAPLDPPARNRLAAALPAAKARAKTISEVLEQTTFATVARPIPIADRARAQLTGDAAGRLAEVGRRLRAVPEWTEATLEKEIAAAATAAGVGLGQIGGPLRAALTGGAPAPSIASVLATLGREEALGRIDDALATA